MESVTRELSCVTAQAETIIHLTGSGVPALLDQVEHDRPQLPTELVNEPMLLQVFSKIAPRVAYLLWACWLSPDTVLQPDLVPLVAWKASLSPKCQRLPALLLARATGAIDHPPIWDQRLASILDERNPLGTPDGRLLLMASPGVPNGSISADLATALSAYFASLQPQTNRHLPPGSLLLRSGQHRILLEAEPRLRIVPVTPSTARRDRSSGPARSPVPLPAGIRVQCSLRGPMLWGAWRGNHCADPPVTRFLTMAGRPARTIAAKFGVSTGGDPGESGQVPQCQQLDSAKPHPLSGSVPTAVPPRVLEHLLHSIERDGALREAVATPYQLIAQQEYSHSLPIALASVPLQAPKPEIPGSGGSHPPVGSSRAAGFVSFYEHISRPRDVATLLPTVPSRPSHADVSWPPGFVSSDESQTNRSGPQSAQPPRINQLSDRLIATREEVSQLAGCIYRSCRHLPQQNASSQQNASNLQVVLSWTRPRRLLWTLMPGIAAATGLSWPSASLSRESWQDMDLVSCTLSASLPSISLKAWQVISHTPEASLGWLRSVSAAMQVMLRALLPMVAYTTESDAADSNWTRAELVFRHARVQAAPPSTFLEDPRDDAVLRRLATSALPGLRRIATSWKDMLQHGDNPWPESTAEAFASRLVETAIARPHPLRKLLLEELEICELFWRLVNPEREARFRPRSTEAKITSIGAHMMRAANRLHAGGSGHTLVPLLILAASGAAARAQGLEGMLCQIQLEPMNIQNSSSHPAVFLKAS